MITKNETLEMRWHLEDILRRKRPAETIKKLPEWKQKIFLDLQGLSGDKYQKKLKELKLKWLPKPINKSVSHLN